MENIDNIFKRYFTQILENNKTKDVFSLFKWKKVNVLLKDYKTGNTIYDMKNLEFHDHF